MTSIISIGSTHSTTEGAFADIQKKLPTNPDLILFFTSTTYDFNELTKRFHITYPNTEVLGVTTVGEITPDGISESGLSAASFEGAGFKAKGVILPDIEKYPIFYRSTIQSALKEVGINANSPYIEEEGLGFVFPCGLVSGEEKMLSVLNSVFKHDGFRFFGGTAGDDAKFIETKVSYNGQVTSKGGVAVFIQTQDDIMIKKENIFVPFGKTMKVTKADPEARIVYELNGKKASTEYARLLGVPESQLNRSFITNPLGRVINNEIWIASPFQVRQDGSIQFYCQIFQDSTVDILQPKSPLETIEESVSSIQQEMHAIHGVFAVNCILRKLQFQNQKIVPEFNRQLSRLPNLFGFCSYGEQLHKNQLNQTLVLLCFGKRKEGRKKHESFNVI